jgi:hypothetical protein
MKLIAIIIIFFIMPSSSLNKKFNSVKIDSIEYIKRQDVNQIIGEDVKIPIISEWATGDYILVRVKVKDDLIEYLKKDTFTFYQHSHFCDKKSEVVLLGLSNIYKDGLSSGDIYSRENFYKILPNDIYEFIIFTSWQKDRSLQESLRNIKSQKFYLKYNLLEESNDICISIAGTNMMSSYKTNEIRITKEQIENVLNSKNL